MILGRPRLLKGSTQQGYKQFAWCVSGVGLTQASGGVIFRPHPALEVLLIADPEGGDTGDATFTLKAEDPYGPQGRESG